MSTVVEDTFERATYEAQCRGNMAALPAELSSQVENASYSVLNQGVESIQVEAGTFRTHYTKIKGSFTQAGSQVHYEQELWVAAEGVLAGTRIKSQFNTEINGVLSTGADELIEIR